MFKLCRQFNLGLEPLLGVRIETLFLANFFDRHRAHAFMVYPSKDIPHAPASDGFEV